ncbi:MAG TPA: patatin-like phospholipase family protein [Acidimicrobiales bacterium]
MPLPDGGVKRSLIMAGGGTKVAFQAGVLQVWIDEAGIEFHHADGASGGVFNLAMWCQGMTGTEIADAWRRMRPLRGVQPAFADWLRLPYARSLFRLDRFRRNVFPDWGLDWHAIRTTTREATFNLYDFTHHEQVVHTPDRMDEDLLVSAVSLPMWFPPVRTEGATWIDAVFATDANLEEAIRRGADELWVVWTVSERGEWNDGFVAQYFQMIEAMANAQLRAVLRRVDASNDAIADGRPGEFGRPITVHLLAGEVPLHYLMNFTRDRMAAAVARGVQAARAWCDERGIERSSPPAAPADPSRPPVGVRFTEHMAGPAALDESDPVTGRLRGEADGTRLGFRLTISVDDLDRFVTDPELAATAVGSVECEALGGRLPVERGEFNLFVDEGDPADKRMLYRLWFRDAAGHRLRLDGHKLVHDEPGLDVWRDTTTLYTTVSRLGDDGEASDGPPVMAGVLRITPASFARQLTTFRATAPTAAARARAISRFGRLFVGSLWDVYAREVLAASPL